MHHNFHNLYTHGWDLKGQHIAVVATNLRQALFCSFADLVQSCLNQLDVHDCKCYRPAEIRSRAKVQCNRCTHNVLPSTHLSRCISLPYAHSYLCGSSSPSTALSDVSPSARTFFPGWHAVQYVIRTALRAVLPTTHPIQASKTPQYTVAMPYTTCWGNLLAHGTGCLWTRPLGQGTCPACWTVTQTYCNKHCSRTSVLVQNQMCGWLTDLLLLLPPFLPLASDSGHMIQANLQYRVGAVYCSSMHKSEVANFIPWFQLRSSTKHAWKLT